jgi:hypothetical protein
MTITGIILSNAALAAFALFAIARVVAFAHRLSPAPVHHDEDSWGLEGNPWVISAPLPLARLAAHEDERERVLLAT